MKNSMSIIFSSTSQRHRLQTKKVSNLLYLSRRKHSYFVEFALLRFIILIKHCISQIVHARIFIKCGYNYTYPKTSYLKKRERNAKISAKPRLIVLNLSSVKYGLFALDKP